MADVTAGFMPGGMFTESRYGGLGFSLPGGGGGGFNLPDPSSLLRFRMEQEARDRDLARQLQQGQLDMQRAQMANMNRRPFQPATIMPTSAPRAQQQRDGYTMQDAQTALAVAAAQPMPVSPRTIGMSTGYLPDTMRLPVGLMPGSASFGASPESQRYGKAQADEAEGANMERSRFQRSAASRGYY